MASKTYYWGIFSVHDLGNGKTEYIYNAQYGDYSKLLSYNHVLKEAGEFSIGEVKMLNFLFNELIPNKTKKTRSVPYRELEERLVKIVKKRI